MRGFATGEAVRQAIIDGTLTRERACDGKQRYHTYAFAEKVRARVEARTGESMVVYLCPFCGGHHLAHRVPTRTA